MNVILLVGWQEDLFMFVGNLNKWQLSGPISRILMPKMNCLINSETKKKLKKIRSVENRYMKDTEAKTEWTSLDLKSGCRKTISDISRRVEIDGVIKEEIAVVSEEFLDSQPEWKQ
jgi:hypothetical protein